VTFKYGLEVPQSRWKWYQLKAWVCFFIRLP